MWFPIDGVESGDLDLSRRSSTTAAGNVKENVEVPAEGWRSGKVEEVVGWRRW